MIWPINKNHNKHEQYEQITPQMIGVQVFPNPAGNELFVKAASSLQTIDLYNIEGKLC